MTAPEPRYFVAMDDYVDCWYLIRLDAREAWKQWGRDYYQTDEPEQGPGDLTFTNPEVYRR